MNGFLVVNAYLKSEKFTELYKHLKKTAEDMGITLDIKTNEEMVFCEDKCDFVLFWDKDTAVAQMLEKRGLSVFNSARAIELCDDKAKTYNALSGVASQPETVTAPLSFGETDYTEFVKKAGERLGYPLVYKERFGSFGEQVFLCGSEKEVKAHINGKPFLLQKYIKESCGEDIRLEIVGGKCVSAMKRKNENDFRSNITNGATAKAYVPTEEEQALAVKVCKALGLDFGGVDILNDGTVCEVNSNAHIINIMNVTGVDIAPIIFNYIIEKL